VFLLVVKGVKWVVARNVAHKAVVVTVPPWIERTWSSFNGTMVSLWSSNFFMVLCAHRQHATVVMPRLVGHESSVPQVFALVVNFVQRVT
jgi:hypothetical protein